MLAQRERVDTSPSFVSWVNELPEGTPRIVPDWAVGLTKQTTVLHASVTFLRSVGSLRFLFSLEVPSSRVLY